MAQKRSPTPASDKSGQSKGSEPDWRLFLAAPLPDHIREVIKGLSTELARRDLPLRFVQPELAHITLHFLGETSTERAELLSLALPAAMTGFGRPELITTETGVFPNHRKPRIVWLGLAGNTEKLIGIHRSLGTVLRSLDFEVESRPFRPHITLARVRDDTPASLAEDVRIALNSPEISSVLRSSPESFEIDRIQLMRSHLGKDGPRYEVVKELALGPRR